MAFFFILMGIVAVFTMFAFRRRNRRMDEANDAYRDAANQAGQAITQANQKLQQISSLISGTDPSRVSHERLGALLDEYKHLHTRVDKERAAARAAHDMAYEAYASGVDKQNMFFGGANNWSVFSLRRRAREFREIRIPAALVNPSQTLIQAYRILDMNRAAAGAAKPAPADAGSSAALPEPGTASQPVPQAVSSTPAPSMQPLRLDAVEAAVAPALPKRKRKRRGPIVFLFLLVLAAVGGYFGSQYYNAQPLLTGSGSAGGLTLSIDQRAVPVLRISYVNGMTPHSLGWVNPSSVLVVTDKGMYSGRILWFGGKKIGAGARGSVFVYSSYQGTISSIVLDEVNALSSRGLPSPGTASNSIVIPVQTTDAGTGVPALPAQEAALALKAGKAELIGLVFTAEEHPGKGLLLKISNTGKRTFALGWVIQSDLTLKASSGEYQRQLDSGLRFPSGAEKLFAFSFPEADGAWQTLSVNRVIQLDNRGLPPGANTTGRTIKITLK